jgi:hypothetical protein
VSLALLAATNRLVVKTAFMQAGAARTLLRPYADPMVEARRVLTAPGPLQPLDSRS